MGRIVHAVYGVLSRSVMVHVTTALGACITSRDLACGFWSVRHRIFDEAPNLAPPWNNFELSSLRLP